LIASLSGRVAQLAADACVLEVAGVGYALSCSTRTLAALAAGEPARLQVETRLTEETILLYGFADLAERDWFRLLTTVQGVGARVALNLLSALGPAEIASAIGRGANGELSRAQGVGPKLAARLCTELRDRVAALPSPALAAAPVASGPPSDAVTALVRLGYRQAEAEAAVAGAQGSEGEGAGTATLIRAALRTLGSS